MSQLLEQLESEDYQVRMLGCRAARRHARSFMLAVHGSNGAQQAQKVSEILQFLDLALDDASPNVVREGLLAAAEFAIAPVWARLKQVMRRERGNFSSLTIVVSVRAFTQVSRVLRPEGRAAVNQLAYVLFNDPAVSVRIAAAGALAKLGNAHGVAVLEAALQSESNQLTEAAIQRALAQLSASLAGGTAP